jgi:hypothetical protein
MEFTETEDRVWKGENGYEIRLFDFCPRPSYDVYLNGTAIAGFDTLRDAQTFAASHFGHGQTSRHR